MTMEEKKTFKGKHHFLIETDSLQLDMNQMDDTECFNNQGNLNLTMMDQF